MGLLRIVEVTCASRFDEEEILAAWWNVRMGGLKRPFSLGQYIYLVIRGADIYCVVDFWLRDRNAIRWGPMQRQGRVKGSEQV